MRNIITILVIISSISNSVILTSKKEYYTFEQPQKEPKPIEYVEYNPIPRPNHLGISIFHGNGTKLNQTSKQKKYIKITACTCVLAVFAILAGSGALAAKYIANL